VEGRASPGLQEPVRLQDHLGHHLWFGKALRPLPARGLDQKPRQEEDRVGGEEGKGAARQPQEGLSV
jgi:hypothetical protein